MISMPWSNISSPINKRATALALALGLMTGASGALAEIGDDLENGEKIWRQCKSCHEIGAGAEDGIGPHLNFLFGRPAGGIEGFRYSKDMVRMGSTGLEWHADTLDAYIENPRALISGTRMSFRGIKDAEDRADLIAFLRTYSDNPRDIPESDPTFEGTDHEVDPEILALVGDAEYGEFLASECTACHQAEGGDSGIPSIVYWPEEDFVIAMHAYKDEVRTNPTMQMIAGRLNAEEIAALAAYFARLD
jgi:cytochrome c